MYINLSFCGYMNNNFEILKMQVNGPLPKKVGVQTEVPGEKNPTTSLKIGTTSLLGVKIDGPNLGPSPF